jgi:hypothetical protein
METTLSSIEPLLERAEEFSKTTVELAKLKLLDKTSSVLSTLLSRLLFSVAVVFFLFTLTMAVSLWLGDLLGENYYGFLIITAFYALVGIVLYFIHPMVKKQATTSIITQFLN